MKEFFQKLYVIPFQIGLACYITINGILSSYNNAAVFQNLQSIVGWFAVIILGIQICSGMAIVLGAGLSNKYFEGLGLITAASLFIIRAFVLLTDGEVSLSDINATILAIIILIACLTRLHLIIYSWAKEVGIWIKK